MDTPVAWQPWFEIESIFRLFQTRQAVYLLIVAGLLGTFCSWPVLGVAIQLGLPAWPTSAYGYGWTLNFFNWWTGFLALAAGTVRNEDLMLWTAIILSVQTLVNLFVMLLQLVGGISGLITLNTTPNLFALISSMLLTFFSAVALTGAWLLYTLVSAFRPRRPVIGPRSEFVSR